MFAIPTMIKMKSEKDCQCRVQCIVWHIDAMRTFDRNIVNSHWSNIQIHFDIHELHYYDCSIKCVQIIRSFRMWIRSRGKYLSITFTFTGLIVLKSECVIWKCVAVCLKFRLCFRLNEKFSTAVVESNPFENATGHYATLSFSIYIAVHLWQKQFFALPISCGWGDFFCCCCFVAVFLAFHTRSFDAQTLTTESQGPRNTHLQHKAQ